MNTVTEIKNNDLKNVKIESFFRAEKNLHVFLKCFHLIMMHTMKYKTKDILIKKYQYFYSPGLLFISYRFGNLQLLQC